MRSLIKRAFISCALSCFLFLLKVSQDTEMYFFKIIIIHSLLSLIKQNIKLDIIKIIAYKEKRFKNQENFL